MEKKFAGLRPMRFGQADRPHYSTVMAPSI
jgi:hypothetical protein